MKTPGHCYIADQIAHQAAYALSMLDRDPFSKTAGCFDRLFWGWKLKDYADATLQRLMYPLTYYYLKIDDSFCEAPQFFQWISKSLECLQRVQHKDGSFDQAFPNEHSHGAAAFLLFDVVRTYELAREKLSHNVQQMTVQMIVKMGDYLVSHDEEHGFISNHLLGAAAGLARACRVTGHEAFRTSANRYVDMVLSRQSSEGWYPEYGSADPGYLTLGIYYLAHIYVETGDTHVLESLKKAVEFVSYFIHPDGSFSGEYGSRNTEIFYPGGLALLSDEIPTARCILDFMGGKIESGRTVNLNSVDVGNLAPLMSNYLELMGLDDGNATGDLPFQREPFIQEFSQAGMVVYNGADTYAVIGASKGGVIKEFDKTTGCIRQDDCGYIGKLKNGTIVSTQQLTAAEYTLSGNEMKISADFYVINQSIPDPVKFLMLRVFNLTVGRFHTIREFVKKRLVKMLLANHVKTDYTLERVVTFADPLQIRDQVTPGTGEFESLTKGVKFSTIHMASSKYYYRR